MEDNCKQTSYFPLNNDLTSNDQIEASEGLFLKQNGYNQIR